MMTLTMKNEEKYHVPSGGVNAVTSRKLRQVTFRLSNYTHSVTSTTQGHEVSALPMYERYSESRQSGELPESGFIASERTTMDEQLESMIARRKPLTIDDLGWTREEAAAVRALFGAMADDWDDPGMDAYDDL